MQLFFFDLRFSLDFPTIDYFFVCVDEVRKLREKKKNKKKQQQQEGLGTVKQEEEEIAVSSSN